MIEGNVSPGTCNAAVNAGGKLLKVVEMQLKYGTATPSGKMLSLVGETDGPAALPDAEPTPTSLPKTTSRAGRIRELEAELAALKKAK